MKTGKIGISGTKFSFTPYSAPWVLRLLGLLLDGGEGSAAVGDLWDGVWWREIKVITLIMVINIILHVCNLSKTFFYAGNVLVDTKHDVVAISRFEDIHGEVIGNWLRPNL